MKIPYMEKLQRQLLWPMCGPEKMWKPLKKDLFIFSRMLQLWAQLWAQLKPWKVMSHDNLISWNHNLKKRFWCGTILSFLSSEGGLIEKQYCTGKRFWKVRPNFFKMNSFSCAYEDKALSGPQEMLFAHQFWPFSNVLKKGPWGDHSWASYCPQWDCPLILCRIG